jgi:ketosteroid isomerase-like protein
MSEDNVDRMRVALRAWNAGDLPGLLEATDPALVFHTSGVFPSIDPVYRGADGFRKFWTVFHEPWESLEIDIERLEDLGERVLALLNFHAVGRDRVEVRMKFANVATFVNGLIVDITAYPDWEQALEAVRLQE